jgi:molybdopterin-containing oxidoreductase family membrane subunit
VLALWVNRYLIVVPTLETPYMPIQDSRMEYLFYNATWVEYVLTFAGIAAFLLFFTVASKIVPIVPVSEVIEIEDEENELKLKVLANQAQQ